MKGHRWKSLADEDSVTTHKTSYLPLGLGTGIGSHIEGWCEMSIPESDWKRFKEVKPVALERFCERVLHECEEVVDDRGLSAYDRYLKLFQLMRERDRELAAAFDDHSRSKAAMQLIVMRRLGLVTDEELHGFSLETRHTVEGVAQES